MWLWAAFIVFILSLLALEDPHPTSCAWLPPPTSSRRHQRRRAHDRAIGPTGRAGTRPEVSTRLFHR